MTRMKAILVLAAALAFALSPLTTTGFNGFSPDQFPVPQTDPPIQPAGWAFSVWGLIYLWLIASAGYGLLRRARDPAWDRCRWLLLSSLTLGAAWIPVATVSPPMATALIWIMWAAAVGAFLRTPDAERGWLRYPVGLYAGWLTAAACVATGVLATGYGATPVLAVHAVFLLLALGLAIAVLRRRPDPAFGAVVIWALVGIAVANLDPARPLMLILCAAGAGLVALSALRRRGP